MDINTRLNVVYLMLSAWCTDDPPPNGVETRRRLERVIEIVEDTFSGVQKAETPGLKTDGRMYPPADDFRVNHGPVSGAEPAVSVFRTTKHNVAFGKNGSFLSYRRDKGIAECLLEGADGRTVLQVIGDYDLRTSEVLPGYRFC